MWPLRPTPGATRRRRCSRARWSPRWASCPTGLRQSTAGEYTSNMFWIVGIALIASWVVAVVFTPYLGVKLLPDFKKVEGGHAAIYDTPRYNRLRRVLARVIARKWLVAGAVVGALRGVDPRHGRGQEAVLSDLRPTRGAGRSADALRQRRSRRPAMPRAKVETWLLHAGGGADRHRRTSGQGAPRFYFAMGPELPDPSFAKTVVRTGQPGGTRGPEAPLAPGHCRWPRVRGAGARDAAGVRAVLAVSRWPTA